MAAFDNSGIVYAGGTPGFNEKTGQYTKPPEWTPPKLDPQALMKQYGYGDWPTAPKSEMRQVTTPATNTTWTDAYNAASQAYNQTYNVKPTQATQAQSYTMPGTNYRQRITFDGAPQEAPKFLSYGNQGNMAYAYDRPAPYSQQSTMFDGTVSAAPDYARRDAFIDQLNARLGQYQQKAGVFSSPQPLETPSFDIQALWDNAGRMVANGWRNPFLPY